MIVVFGWPFCNQSLAIYVQGKTLSKKQVKEDFKKSMTARKKHKTTIGTEINTTSCKSKEKMCMLSENIF